MLNWAQQCLHRQNKMRSPMAAKSTSLDLQNGQGQFSGNGGVIISASEPATTATQREGLHATSKRARSLSGPSPWVSEDFPLSSDVRLGWLQTGRELLGVAEVEETVRSAEVDPNVIRPALSPGLSFNGGSSIRRGVGKNTLRRLHETMKLALGTPSSRKVGTELHVPSLRSSL